MMPNLIGGAPESVTRQLYGARRAMERAFHRYSVFLKARSAIIQNLPTLSVIL